MKACQSFHGVSGTAQVIAKAWVRPFSQRSGMDQINRFQLTSIYIFSHEKTPRQASSERQAVLQQILELLCRHRPAVEIALHFGTALRLQEGQLPRRLHPL